MGTYRDGDRLLADPVDDGTGKTAYIQAVKVVAADGTAQGTTANPSAVVGNVAAGTADSGNPVKVGGKYNATLPTLTDGQRGDLQLGARGSLNVTLFGSDSSIAVNLGQINSDAVSSGTYTLSVRNFGHVFNGTTWDRQRGDTSGIYVSGASYWTESSVALGSAATINGTLRQTGGTAGSIPSRFNFFVAEAFADQAGTLYIDKTADNGGTWRQVGSIAAAVGSSVSLKVPISVNGYRARFVNGATAQGAFLLTSSYTTA